MVANATFLKMAIQEALDYVKDARLQAAEQGKQSIELDLGLIQIKLSEILTKYSYLVNAPKV